MADRNPADMNGDGMISEAEFLRPLERRQDDLFLRLDRNADNLITSDDLPEQGQRRQPPPEILAAREQMRSCFSDAGIDRRNTEGGLRNMLAQVREGSLTLDLDAFVTPAEDRAAETFHSMDMNGDGMLDQSELSLAREARFAERQQTRASIRNCITELRQQRERQDQEGQTRAL